MSAHASKYLAGLNSAQQQAVLATDGPVLVVAGPGSGKTRVLTHRIAHIIDDLQVMPDQILAVTFTNKAAGEMKHRIDALAGAGTSQGLWMGTFHSLGVRFLRQNPGIVADRLGLLPNFLIYDDGDQMDLAKKAVVAVGLDPKQVAPRRMLSRISQAKASLQSPEDFAAEVSSYDDEVALRVYREYHKQLRQANAVDFDDLLVLPIRLFDAAPALLERYQQKFRYILVDEYQDTNRVQYVLVAALAGYWRNLFVVGDPDQSIYAWRQADIRNILDFNQDYPDATVIKLEVNYRSTRRIVETADRLIQENTQRIERALRTDNPDGEPVTLRELADERHEARFIVDEVRRLVRLRGAKPEQVAVMYRTTAQSRVLEEAFRMSDIPYRIVGGLRFYERKEVKDVIAVLRLLHNPQDDLSLTRVIDNMPHLGKGIGPKAMETMREWAAAHRLLTLDAFCALAPTAAPVGDLPALSGQARQSATRLGTVFAQLRELEKELTLSQLFDAIVDRTGYSSAFNHENEEDMERWANVLELRSDLEDFDALAPGEALAAYLDQVQLVSDADTMKDGEQGQVTMITLHSAKGLEFPIVFIAGVEEGLLPIYRAIENEYTDPTAIEEERRLFYVGLTRAEQLLFLTYTGGRSRYGRYEASMPSRFLTNLPVEHVKSAGARPTAQQSLVDRAREGMRGSGAPTPIRPGVDVGPGRSGGGARSDDGGLRVVGGSGSGGPSWAPKPVAPPPAPTYTAGMEVFHPKFGEGKIVEVADRRGDQELAIEFKRHGVKRLLASLAKLDII